MVEMIILVKIRISRNVDKVIIDSNMVRNEYSWRSVAMEMRSNEY